MRSGIVLLARVSQAEEADISSELDCRFVIPVKWYPGGQYLLITSCRNIFVWLLSFTDRLSQEIPRSAKEPMNKLQVSERKCIRKAARVSDHRCTVIQNSTVPEIHSPHVNVTFFWLKPVRWMNSTCWLPKIFTNFFYQGFFFGSHKKVNLVFMVLCFCSPFL